MKKIIFLLVILIINCNASSDSEFLSTLYGKNIGKDAGQMFFIFEKQGKLNNLLLDKNIYDLIDLS